MTVRAHKGIFPPGNFVVTSNGEVFGCNRDGLWAAAPIPGTWDRRKTTWKPSSGEEIAGQTIQTLHDAIEGGKVTRPREKLKFTKVKKPKPI